MMKITVSGNEAPFRFGKNLASSEKRLRGSYKKFYGIKCIMLAFGCI